MYDLKGGRSPDTQIPSALLLQEKALICGRQQAKYGGVAVFLSVCLGDGFISHIRFWFYLRYASGVVAVPPFPRLRVYRKA